MSTRPDTPPPFLVPRLLTPMTVAMAAFVLRHVAGAVSISMRLGWIATLGVQVNAAVDLACLVAALRSRTTRGAVWWLVGGAVLTRLSFLFYLSSGRIELSHVVIIVFASLVFGLARLVLVIAAHRLRGEASHDRPDRGLAVAGVWLVTTSALSCTVGYGSRLPHLALIGVGVLVAALAMLDERRIRLWLARVRAGQEPRWSIVPRSESDAVGLMPLVHAPAGAATDAVLRHSIAVDAASPYRGGNATEDVALVGLDPASDGALERWVARWARLGFRIALAVGGLAALGEISGGH